MLPEIKGVVEGKAVVRLKGYSTCHILLVVSVFAPKGGRSFRMLLDDVSLLSVVFNVTILSHGVMLLQLLLERPYCGTGLSMTTTKTSPFARIVVVRLIVMVNAQEVHVASGSQDKNSQAHDSPLPCAYSCKRRG